MADGRLISHFFFTLTVDRCSVLLHVHGKSSNRTNIERERKRERELKKSYLSAGLSNTFYPKGHARSGKREEREREVEG